MARTYNRRQKKIFSPLIKKFFRHVGDSVFQHDFLNTIIIILFLNLQLNKTVYFGQYFPFKRIYAVQQRSFPNIGKL